MRLPLNVFLLTGCLALNQTALSLNMTVAALAGTLLAGSDAYLATLPLAFTFLALMASSAPVSLMMGRFGRKRCFAAGSLVGCAGGLVMAYAMIEGSLWLFAAGQALFGYATATANYYRFAAAESVPDALRSRAISTALTGGVVAAILGPFLGVQGSDFFVYSFAGSYLVMAALSLAILPLVSIIPLPAPVPVERKARGGGRPLGEIARQPVFLVAVVGAMVGYGAMNLIMVSTPTAMVGCGFVMGDAMVVIQWHVLGMYLPSFFTGHLIRRYGAPAIMAVGAALIVACAAINLTGVAFAHFLSSLVLLGLGWNFLYIGGSTLVTEAYRPEERARTLGLNELLVTGTTAMTALSSGALFATLGWNAVNLAVLPALLIVLAALLWFRTRQRPLALS